MAVDTRGLPTSEIGATTFAPYTPAPFGNFLDQTEVNAKLRWPSSVLVFEEMLNDAQISALRDATELPIRRRLWSVDPNGAPDDVVEHLASDFGLPVHGQDVKPHDVPRDEDAFDWTQHLQDALLAPWMGHYYFEQTVTLGGDGLLHLAKLAPRAPRTIMQLNISSSGDLEWIRQKFGPSTVNSPMTVPDPIPGDRLVPYVWGAEGGNWVGRSMLRPLYKHYLRKDGALRGDAQRNSRNAMGVPTIEAPQGATPQQMRELAAIAQAFRSGDYAGVALPFGAKLRLVGVEGGLPNIIDSVRYDDEQMARRFLAMFIQLGQTKTGSRALGDSFIDFFALGLDAMSDWICARTNLALRRIVTWNWGAQTRCPRVVSERDEDPELSAADLVAMVSAGVITVDPELEATIRERKGLPPRDPGTAQPVAPSTTPGSVPQSEHPSSIPGSGAVSRRRDTHRHGRAADANDPASVDAPDVSHVDWAGIDATWQSQLQSLLLRWGAVQEDQIDELVALITAAGGDLTVLPTIAATSRGADIVAAAMQTMAAFGVQQAQQEATVHGATLPDPDVTELSTALQARSQAVADVLARSISEAAGRQAVQRTGGPLAPQEVAQEVGDHLRGLSNQYLQDQLGGALTQGFNGGRRFAMRGAPDGARFLASSVLDTNACIVCSEEDGHEFDSLAAAEEQFPTGGNKDCLGGPRCRCTLVGIYNEAAPSVQ